MIAHYKKLNMPLEEIKERLMLNQQADQQKMAKHLDKIADMMLHLEMEIKDIKPVLERLNDQQKELMINKMSPKSAALAHALLLLIG